ncbi:hypothetical protein NU195Hw_g3492t1 [Hortaea werneckii]
MASATAKQFLVTGAGRGIGRGLSRLLLQKGNRVFLVDNNTEELNHTAHQLAQKYGQGQDFEISITDLRKASDIQRAAQSASKFFNGKLDCLVNNAASTSGVGGPHLSDGQSFIDTWNQSLETNLTGPMLMSQACLPMLENSASQEGNSSSIIHISSTRAIQSELNNEPYSTTKAGLLGLTQSMAVSLADRRIRVNAILPGWINVSNECKAADEKGEKWEDGLSKDDQAWHLTGRVGKVEDMLKAVEYLVHADFATGTEIVVDGGVTRKMVYPE